MFVQYRMIFSTSNYFIEPSNEHIRAVKWRILSWARNVERMIYIYIYIYIYIERERERERGGAAQREKGNVYMILVGKSQGKKPLLRSRHRREDKIKLDLK
jgi:hypothetical protein